MPVFTNPAAFWGAFSLLGMVAIYLFRRRSRDVVVSSLMFWSRIRIPSEGGLKVTVLQTPLLLLIELLVLILFILAATNPRILSGDQMIPLVLIVDDSLSMSVNGLDSPGARAVAYARDNIFSRNLFRVSIVRAGVSPELIGRQDLEAVEASELLSRFRFKSPAADLNAAIAYANEIFPLNTRVVVLTDVSPPSNIKENISWFAFGEPVANMAITAANRYELGNIDRCFVEFSNFSRESRPLKAQITVENGNSGSLLENIDEVVKPNAVRRLRFNVRDVNARVKVRIESACPDFDNEVWLFPVRKKTVRTAMNISNIYLRNILQKTLKSTGLAVITDISPEIVFSDANHDRASNENSGWQFIFHIASSPALIRGTASVDKIHPLTEGLPPLWAAWAVDAAFVSTGRPVISFENLHLLEIEGGNNENMKIRFNFSHAYSTIQKTTFWPVLFHNLLKWRQLYFPGPDDTNYRSGIDIGVTLPPDSESLRVESPSGERRDIKVHAGRVLVSAQETGIYSFVTEKDNWQASVNLLSPSESDLREKVSETGIGVIEAMGHTHYFKDVRWWFLVPAMLLLALHQWLIMRRRPGYVY